jgi:dTDP-4-amino-4,6-dideoxygalactose transaminase
MRAGRERAGARAEERDPIPAVDPAAGYRAQRAEIDAAIDGVLRGGSYVLGERVAAFEAAFARYLGVGHAVGVANGTDAIALALRALGVGPGDRVATVAHTAVATVAAIAMAGASPVLVDIDPVRCTMDPSRLEDALAAAPVAAVLLVHLYGQPADIDAIASVARRHGAALVEDCAQAHGATWAGRRVGGFGDAAAFSFYPTKNLGSLGDGGLVATDDPAIAARVRALRQYGWGNERISAMPGVNSRLHELQAAILGARLAHLDADNARRRAIADRYDTRLAATGLHRPPRIAGCEPVFHQYVVRTEARDALRASLAAAGVGTGVHYPVPVHRQPAYRDVALGPGGLPCTERAAASVLSLPMYPQLTDDQVARVAEAVAHAADQLR